MALRPATISSYVSIARMFEKTVGDLSEDGIVRFLSRISKPSTKNRYRMMLAHFMNYLGREDLVKYLKTSMTGIKYLEWFWK